ncbi:type IV toxin-antitoxin system AbiEi family antitoxin domain-containing protein [Pseudoclavibacter sp. Z016]|uniref:type IV toxin-antitoxin system AbiEi family antitoxin domain-containing protein n=1 Tax=Pseudoclavibacter sp. Z016 TaxID=2080581 RepID=UPI000CE8E79F|nr:type IV toxin-antitoxin system AbiEi family antitoxin domain-containing protein [Pseudoclavibacter sp. Z016]PPF72624.1 transcriptional regulator [Pseudoclavibacter sp. Z016]
MSTLRALVDVMSNQWGLVTAKQAESQGVRRDQLSRLEQRGLLARVIRGVYKDAAAGLDEFDELRAHWLVLEPGATAIERLTTGREAIVVSGPTASYVHGYGDLQPSPFEFSTTERRQSKHAGLRLRRRNLSPRDVTLRAGLPVTTIERTVADLVADHEDLSLVGAVLGDAVRARGVDFAVLSQHLAPLARANGFTGGEGAAFREHLLELSGSDERTQLMRILNAPAFEEVLRAALLKVEILRASTSAVVDGSDVVVLVKSVLASVLASHGFRALVADSAASLEAVQVGENECDGPGSWGHTRRLLDSA